MRRVCKYCGEEYDGSPSSSACQMCTAKNRSTSIRPRACVVCERFFPGGPSAKYCPDCRIERKRERDRAWRKRGAARPIGSTDICIVCGESYTVTGGLQKYCPGCAEEAIKAKDRQASIAWNRENTTVEGRRAERQQHSATIICIICGKPFVPTNRSKCCSAECADKLRRKNMAKRETEHREERNEYHRRKYNEKVKSMTPEEYRAYRNSINEKARAAYSRRKKHTKPC